jgi:hypothetical protein
MVQKMTLVKDDGARRVLEHYGNDIETPNLTGECNFPYRYSQKKKKEKRKEKERKESYT